MLQCYTGISSFNCHLLAVIDQNGLKEKWETIRKMKNCLWLPQEDNVEVEILVRLKETQHESAVQGRN